MKPIVATDPKQLSESYDDLKIIGRVTVVWLPLLNCRAYFLLMALVIFWRLNNKWIVNNKKGDIYYNDEIRIMNPLRYKEELNDNCDW